MSSPNHNTLEAKIFANAFNLIPEIGPVTLNKLINYFNDWYAAWIAHPAEYARAGLHEKTINQIIAKKTKINPEQSFAETTRRQIEIILATENSYPKLLKQIHATPPLLYVRGRKDALNNLSIAVVGTRNISNYGKMATSEIVSGLVTNSVTIVSGLAYGVDSQALETVVKNGGCGIAVLASDLDNSSISPRTNFNLSQKIIENGCLVSEYPLGHPSQKQNFPIRNRIISGLACGTLVIEADSESGSLITANFALEQNREVFAVPGSIFSPVSRGTNHLIQKGARLVISAYDILEELNLDIKTVNLVTDMNESEEEEIILQVLTREPTSIEDLIKTVKLKPAKVSASLTLLEMKGRVKNLGGAKYAKIR